MVLFLLLLFLQPVIELLLVVKEKEFILKNLAAAHLSLNFHLVPLGHSLQIVLVLLDLHVSLLLLLL